MRDGDKRAGIAIFLERRGFLPRILQVLEIVELVAGTRISDSGRVILEIGGSADLSSAVLKSTRCSARNVCGPMFDAPTRVPRLVVVIDRILYLGNFLTSSQILFS